ncbi:GNAT family N-acetyltransferase [Bacillus sp. PS06]|uniref:GNAT family N-acetyltransferase n=1 Tax=Bacillus sp. PS06 TaxID=2764176 RepID=UPI00177C71FE|nr:GNAT family N-acetyltransferase [Bacillus sp. PS06]MBD8070535.1 GNAT family N-acetyltransferase [Bacillus sp. PS06]
MQKIRHAVLSDSEGIARVQVESWLTTYKGIVPDAYLNSLQVQDKQKVWTRILEQGFETSCAYVAVNESNEIIGFANGGKERSGKYEYDAELYAIYLLKEYQGMGIGKKLVNRLCNNLYEKGYQSMLVWFLKDNPSRKFYESMNPELVGTATIFISGVELEEQSYGWRDMKALIEKRADE